MTDAARRRTYLSWYEMKRRCYDPRSSRWHRYGGRGITVCARWIESFENFIADMGMRPEGMTLDRIENDGNYEPDNCRWATIQVQNRNNGQNNAEKTHCPHGHPLSGENLYVDPRGKRQCRTCRRVASRQERLAA